MLFSIGFFSASYVTGKADFCFSSKKKRSWSYQSRTFSKKPGGREVSIHQGQNTDVWPKIGFIIFILDFGKTSTQVSAKEHKSPQNNTSTCVLSITLEENVATKKNKMSRPFSKQCFQTWKNQAGRKQVWWRDSDPTRMPIFSKWTKQPNKGYYLPYKSCFSENKGVMISKCFHNKE